MCAASAERYYPQLRITPGDICVDETIKLYDHESDPATVGAGLRRQLAVEAALTLMVSECHGSGDRKSSLESNLEKLGVYADHIQKALRPKA
jgi:hypothetical protein